MTTEEFQDPLKTVTEDKFEGCLLGLSLGDALGAPFEGGPIERFLWKFIGTNREGEMRWTDDTQMSIDVAESLVTNHSINANDLANRFAQSYQWNRGYGPGAAKLLKRIARGQDWQLANKSVHPTGSFGNGGAMRAPVLALFLIAKPNTLANAVTQATSITHAHPLGIEGALLVAKATACSLQEEAPMEILKSLAGVAEHAPFSERIEVASGWLCSGILPAPKRVASQLGNGMTATESCITAVFVALSFFEQSFEAMQNFIAKCGGDVDTIGAMAGAIWGAKHGKAKLPTLLIQKLEQNGRISMLARALYANSIIA
jgi:poly(ADP-ribose) glycohydrolase ARH3